MIKEIIERILIRLKVNIARFDLDWFDCSPSKNLLYSLNILFYSRERSSKLV